jgi:hypothetical protein
MRFGLFAFYCCLFLPCAVQADTPLKIFWWNIEKGLTNRIQGHNPLNRHLLNLATAANSPDAIVLAEFEYDAVERETLARLRENFVERFIPYNAYATDVGVGLWVKKNVTLETFPLRTLDWTPDPEATEEKKHAYRERHRGMDYEAYLHDRYYLRFRLSRGSQNINLVPVHALMPWLTIKNRWGGGFVGKVASATSLLWGWGNPLINQTRSLRKALEADFGPNLDRENIVLLGDFNVPPRLGPFEPRAYRTFRKNLKVGLKASESSFPTPEAVTANQYPKLLIDHVFHNEGLELAARVVRMKGSDHDPLEIVVQNRRPPNLAACEAKLRGKP